jgi:hypothetical protein
MEYKELNEINKTLKTTDVKGKNYVEVNERVKGFRQLYPNGDIQTNIISLENGTVVIKADIYDNEGKHIASGIAQEKENSSFINKTSYVENCETSAVGRALGFLGLGIETSIASAEEVENAINNQTDKIDQTQIQALNNYITKNKIDRNALESLLSQFDAKEIKDINKKDLSSVSQALRKLA